MQVDKDRKIHTGGHWDDGSLFLCDRGFRSWPAMHEFLRLILESLDSGGTCAPVRSSD